MANRGGVKGRQGIGVSLTKGGETWEEEVPSHLIDLVKSFSVSGHYNDLNATAGEKNIVY